MTHFSFPLPRPVRWAIVTAAALAIGIVAGCGSAGNTDAARIRAVDASTDTGTANLLVNGSASYGDQVYFASSGYFYISTGVSTLTAVTNTETTAVPARSTTYTLSSGNFYTAFLVGRPVSRGITDNRYTEVLLSNDAKPALTAGQAALRVINAAPDAGRIDVLANGAAPSPLFTDLAFPVARTDQLVGAYVTVAAGTLSVQVNLTGTATPLIPATPVAVLAGRSYTLLVTEPTAGTAVAGTAGGTAPTYALKVTTD